MPQMFYDAMPDLYDSARPGYPATLPRDIRALLHLPESAQVLEIGCGTGKATLPFAREGYCITAIDVGPGLVDFARTRLKDYPNVAVHLSSFEEWHGDPSGYDMIIAATAFHWVDASHTKHLVELLRPNGHVAIFWHTFLDGSHACRSILDAIYRRHAPGLYQEDILSYLEAADRSREQQYSSVPGLTDHRFIRYYDSVRYNADQYVQLLHTFSTHAGLPESFWGALREAIESGGGTIDKLIRTTLWIASRKMTYDP